MAPPPNSLPNLSGDDTRRDSALSFVLSGVMLLIYCGFVLLVAYAKSFLGTQIVPGLSWGILLGALVIVSAWVLTVLYVMAANKKGGA